jgi:hypothetical protein
MVFQVTVISKVTITSAFYANGSLFVSGVGFGTSPTVLINNAPVAVTYVVPGSTDTSLTVKGSRKKINLRKGTNTIQIIGAGGQKSNTLFLQL